MSLSDEDAGLLIKAILAYETGDTFSLPPVPNAFFTMMKAYLDRDAEKWAQTVEKRRQAGAKGGAASGRSRKKQAEANEANASLAKQTKQAEANEANQANQSCNDVSCFDMSLQDPKVGKDSHTHKIYGGTGACASPPPLNGEDLAELRDAAQAHHRRGDYEFSLIRQAYDAVKAEAPQAGYPEFLRLYNSTEWRAGMHEEVLHGLDALAKGDRQFLGEERYRPGLAKFLTQEMWKMKPRAPDGQSGVKTPEDEELERRVQENERKMRQRMAERKKLLG